MIGSTGRLVLNADANAGQIIPLPLDGSDAYGAVAMVVVRRAEGESVPG